MAYLLDTNIVTAILKRNENINNKLKEVNRQGQEVFISCITYYELKRGLLYANATRQLSDLNQLIQNYRILWLDSIEIIERACEIHANLKSRGRPIQDADILIAATAITQGLILVSNDSDMLRVAGITLENWMNLKS